MSWLGDFAATNVSVHYKFITANASGKPTTLGDSPSLILYVNSSVSGVPSGLSVTPDLDGRTGLNDVRFLVTTSVTGITSGTECQIVIATGSVSGVSLNGYPICHFSLMNRPVQGIATVANANVTSISTVVNANVTAISTVVNANVTAISTNVGAVVTAANTNIGAIVTGFNTIANANVTSISTVVNANVTSLALGIISYANFNASTLVNNRLDVNVGTMASVTVIGSGSSAALWRGA